MSSIACGYKSTTVRHVLIIPWKTASKTAMLFLTVRRFALRPEMHRDMVSYRKLQRVTKREIAHDQDTQKHYHAPCPRYDVPPARCYTAIRPFAIETYHDASLLRYALLPPPMCSACGLRAYADGEFWGTDSRGNSKTIGSINVQET